ncbi:transferase [Clostridium aceticum]|uniref:Acetyltransferase n=1 Tax=Clostridium aceticum TaxID=84022 RepID=A0A0D8I8R9_9CLOT|nr:transferase [Clostridium aceticum]KJF25636.1 hypothetical protein TZ02_17605 [Clostridium aceticum]
MEAKVDFGIIDPVGEINGLLGLDILIAMGATIDLKEFAKAIIIGNNVWVGGGTIICPGVKIGDNVTIGAGSVVTKDIPSNVVAAGNPCKVIREI